MSDPNQQEVAQALQACGLSLRGGWSPTVADALPALPDGRAPEQVWLAGIVGSAFWPHFQSSAFFSDGQPDPLDRWSRAIGSGLAQRFGGLALYPFDGPPYYPFQRWADRCEPTQPSALLLRIHPEYGLWHAYRFALAVPAPATPDAPAPPAPPGAAASTALCARCSGQPCLQACPVQAYSGGRLLLQACADHLHGDAGSDCMLHGCLARRACPVGAQHRYLSEHAAFHMQAFRNRH